MGTCYKCGGEIEFYHNGFNAVPIHVSGSCSASGGSISYGSGSRWVERETESGQRFVFGWIEYVSYVNPNATCPRCGKSVYFYQSPSGGRVYFNELGPPWPRHGPSPWECSGGIENEPSRTSNISPSIGPLPVQSDKLGTVTIQGSPNLTTPEWRKADWRPLLLSKAKPTGGGIVIDGNALLEDSKNVEHKLVQLEIQDTFQEARGELVFSYSMTMNPNRLISALTENVVFIRRVSEPIYELSTVSITMDDEIIRFTFRMKSS